MLKRFFTVMLGSLAAIWLTGIILFLGFFLVLASVVGRSLSSANSLSEVRDKSVLYIDLSGTITERYTPGPLVEEIMQQKDGQLSLSDILSSIKEAANDDRIEGVYLYCGGASMGIASRQELIGAIEGFRKSGKWVLAYGDYYSQGDYYVACSADEIYLNPVGAVDVRGLASVTPFFKGLMDKMGIQMQVIKVGQYKSAVEPFILTEASEPSKQQTRRYVDGIWDVMVGYIAERRGVDPDSVQMWADDMAMTFSAETCVDKNIAGRLAYSREVEDILKNRCGLDKKDKLRVVTPEEYVMINGAGLESQSKQHIAVLYALGDIVDSGKGGIVSEDMVPEILRLSKDDNVSGMVLRVNSGGGSAFASEQIWDALEQFKAEGKPVYVSMGDVAASGGYYISCGADKIYADQTTLTGSIGIFGMIPCLKGLVTDKLGVTFSTVSTNPNASAPSLYEPMTPLQHKRMQDMVEHGYETFVGRVAQGRGMSVDSVKVIAEGRVWYGEDALSIGLVDELGGLDAAIRAMAERVGLDESDYVEYPAIHFPLLLMMLRQADVNAAIGDGIVDMVGQYAVVCGESSSYAARFASLVEQFIGQSPLQARMEDVIIE